IVGSLHCLDLLVPLDTILGHCCVGNHTCSPSSIFTRPHWSEAQAFRRDFVHPWLPPGLATRQNELYGSQKQLDHCTEVACA
ncbi:hypothetical protein F5890DRAFT_1538613, partial [Lentinula detonsa]